MHLKMLSAIWRPGGRLNTKETSNHYSHVKDKTVSPTAFFNMGILLPVKYGLYIETGPNLSSPQDVKIRII